MSNLWRLRHRRSGATRIGTNANDETISIENKTRASHLHVIGRTRTGKSRFLADLITQDITNGNGVCVIDPHGELYDYVMGWLLRNPLAAKYRRIHPVKVSDPSSTFVFNPLAVERPEDVYGAASVVAGALTKIYGGTDPNQTPLIAATLNTICVILAERGLPLAAAEYFLSEEHKAVRERIVREHSDPYYRALGEQFSRMSAAEFRETVKSTERRIRKFVGNPLVRQMFSQTEQPISFRTAMDRGDVLLFNLSKSGQQLGRDELQALGIMLSSTIFETATERDPRDEPRPFFFYIDEVQNYVTADIEDILSQASKFGLFLTLSHQHLGQLWEAGERIYNSVLSGALLKAVFGLSHQEATVFVDELFADQIDPERRKESLATPHVVGHRVRRLANASSSNTSGRSKTKSDGGSKGATAGASTTDTVGETDSHSWSRSSGESASQSEGVSVPEHDPAEPGARPAGIYSSVASAGSFSSSTYGEAHATSRSRARMESWSDTVSSNWSTALSNSSQMGFSSGWSEALEPIIEWFSTQSYSLEEQRYLLARQLSHAPPRHAFLSALGQGSVEFRTRNLPDQSKLPIGEARLLSELEERSEWIVSADTASENARLLREHLTGEAPVVDEEGEFWSGNPKAMLE